MNRSTIVIVACGFFFALLAAVAIQMVGGKGKKDEVSAQVKTVDVLVAAKDLNMGEELGVNATEWAPWPEGTVFSGAVVREGGQSAGDALKGRVARPVAKGEPIMKSALIADTTANMVAASLTPGKRAVAINVNAQSSVAGFLTPGDHVDVLMTYEVKLPEDERMRAAAAPKVSKLATETVLENLRVLATDQTTDKSSEAKLVKTVTLEVDPVQAEHLVLAGKMGSLSLVMRSIGDASPAHPDTGKPFETTTDMRLSRLAGELVRGENYAGSPTQVVRVYSGNRVENVAVRPYSPAQ